MGPISFTRSMQARTVERNTVTTAPERDSFGKHGDFSLPTAQRYFGSDRGPNPMLLPSDGEPTDSSASSWGREGEMQQA